jgi:hypothetical protein
LKLEHKEETKVETMTIIGALSALALAASCFSPRLRLLSVVRGSGRDLRAWKKTEDAQAEKRIARDEELRAQLARPAGRKRESSILGLSGNVLRHTDGSYTKAYHVSLNPTIFSESQVIEARVNDLARLLAVRKPVGTVIQFRLSCRPDRGRAIRRHLRSRDERSAVPLAGLLHTMGVTFYEQVAAQGAFREMNLSVWVRVPIKHQNDEANKGLVAFFPTLRAELRRHGLASIFAAILSSWRALAQTDVTRRLIEDEKQSCDEAERTFRVIERQSPVSLKAFTRDELWKAVYLGHRQNASSAPTLPSEPGVDIRDYLCGETIAGSGYFLMHGMYPAAVVSMFVPPQPTIYADAMRALSINSELNFRHTIITEYIYLDQQKARKSLDRRIRQVRRASRNGPGILKSENFEGRRALAELTSVREEITGDTQALTEARFYAVIYGESARTRDELHESIKSLDRYCENLVTAIRRIPGADAEREEPAALRATYHRALVGETDARPTGREITETADSLAPLTPTESAWQGSERPHTLCATPTRHLIGFDLYDRNLVTSPLVLIMAAAGGGKSVLLSRIITDTLASKGHLRVRVGDYGKSQEPLGQVIGARHIRFDTGNRTINVWDYPSLEHGVMPDDLQISYVVGDLMLLARVPKTDTIGEDILTLLTKEVYKNQVPRNKPGRPKHEPRLSHLLDLLRVAPFKEEAARRRCETLRISLETFRNDPWLDAPTHEDFARDSYLDIFEFDSIEFLPDRIKESLAYRIAAQIMRTMGQKEHDGTHSPVLLAFDEMHILGKRFPNILEVIERAARSGRKQNVVTILASQAYEDYTGTHDAPNPIGIALCNNAGVKFIGKQMGDYARLAADTRLSPTAVAAIESIKNIAGSHAQFLAVFGSGQDKVVEMLQLDLSPVELWTYTTNPDERNARARVAALRPYWPLAMVIGFLAEQYPRGLTAQGLIDVDEALLLEAA